METVYLNSTNLDYWKNKATSNVMALGFFDGIHKGHQKVIRTAVKKAKEKGVSVSVMSFFPHPKTVLSKGAPTFDYIMPLKEKGKVLERLGVDTFYIVTFDKTFASLSPEVYVSNYLIDFGVEHAVAGYDFSYGKFGAGHIDRLKDDSNGSIDVTKVSKVDYQGEKISSTWVRQMLLSGDIEDLPNILGRSYELACKWDGAALQPLPYYTVPAAGCYSVTIHTGYGAVQANVVVSENRDAVYPREPLGPDHLGTNYVTIAWHYRVQAGAAYAYSL